MVFFITFLSCTNNFIDNNFKAAEESKENAIDQLHIAAANGDIDSYKSLLEKGVNINALNSEGLASFHVAAINGHLDICKFLVDVKEVEVDLLDSKQFTPLYHAVIHKREGVIVYLIEQGANVNLISDGYYPPLFFIASGWQDYDLFKLFIDNGANINAKAYDGTTLLICLVSSNSIEMLKRIIKMDNLNINLQNDEGRTALHYAARYNFYDCTQILIENGAKKDIKDSKDNTPLDIAVSENHLQIIDLLRGN